MNIKPVKKYDEPDYPTKDQVMKNPELLKIIPDRWKGNLYVTAALSALLAITLSGCNNDSGNKTAAPLEKSIHSIPIFEHGKGRGSFGCDSVAPPALISEEEAFQVIQEEAKSYNISFEKSNMELKNINLPQVNLFSAQEKEEVLQTVNKGSLKLDGYDANKNIGFDFISKEEYDQWQKEDGMYSSVESYDFLQAAKVLRTGVNKSKEVSVVGIFYNPIAASENEKFPSKETSEEQLRKQIQDFFQWLKAQGII